MRAQKIIKILMFTLFVVVGIFSILTLSISINAEGDQAETGTLSGTIKVLRARHSGDALVYLEGESLKKEYPPNEKHPIVDQKNLAFTPHVLPILKGTTVDFHNSDDVQHNVFSPGKAEKFNLGTWGLDGEKQYTFNQLGEVVLLCNVHSEMLSYIIILENPYFSKTDTEGNFRIENIPPGTYTLKIWHERMKTDPQQVTIAKGEIEEIHLELKDRK